MKNLDLPGVLSCKTLPRDSAPAIGVSKIFLGFLQ